jgi:hypothetical protein
LAEAETDLATADQKKAEGQAQFRQAVRARQDTRPISAEIQAATEKATAAQMLAALLKQELQQAEDTYRGAWETKRDAFLASKVRDAQAKRTELEKGLSGYAASVTLRLHGVDRVLSHLHAVTPRTYLGGQTFNPLPAPEPD